MTGLYPNEILLTGLPRSGTTMMCHLLNKLDNVVALHEPMNTHALSDAGLAKVNGVIHDFALKARAQVLETGTAPSKASDGKVPSNHLTDKIRGDGQRERNLNGNTIAVTNVTAPDFLLCIKHPAVFTGLLPTLSESFRCVASVRNPLAVLMSWRTAGMKVSEGKLPATQRVDPVFAKNIDKRRDAMDRQLYILDYFFQRYLALPKGDMIRYEDVIATGGAVLGHVAPAAAAMAEPLSSRNVVGLGADPAIRDMGKRLLASDGAYWQVYDRADVERMLD